MNLIFLGGNQSEPDTIEIEYWQISFWKLLKLLRKIDGLTIIHKDSFIFTDDYWADFKYNEYVYNISSPFVNYWIERPKNAPYADFKNIANLLSDYKVPFYNRPFFEATKWITMKIRGIMNNKRKSARKIK